MDTVYLCHLWRNSECGNIISVRINIFLALVQGWWLKVFKNVIEKVQCGISVCIIFKKYSNPPLFAGVAFQEHPLTVKSRVLVQTNA